MEIPKDWNDIGHITWIGGCKDGYAQGLGVLRRTAYGVSPDHFSGRVDQENLRIGVLESGAAGPWEAGSVTRAHEDDENYRGFIMGCYEEGAKAADATAKYMARHSDATAARFYTRLAKRLRFQMDE